MSLLSDDRPADRVGTAAGERDAAETAPITMAPGRWLHGYQPEHPEQWPQAGRAIARRNLGWSIFAEFLGFVVWQLWAITVVFLPRAGFELTTSQTFWLISLPVLVGATLRIPYTFMVPTQRGRRDRLGPRWCAAAPVYRQQRFAPRSHRVPPRWRKCAGRPGPAAAVVVVRTPYARCWGRADSVPHPARGHGLSRPAGSRVGTAATSTHRLVAP